MENFEQMHLIIIKENYPLIACVTLVDITHLIYDNEVLIGMDSSGLCKCLTHRPREKSIHCLLSHFTLSFHFIST